MKQQSARLHPGDWVEVKAPGEILQTLDLQGTLDHLPFMPEMLAFCGQRFRISSRAEMTCASGMSSPRGFKINDVVTLENLRCSGTNHDGCQKACMIFWREGWLRKVEDSAVHSKTKLEESHQLQARLKVSTDQKTYFCQASELANFTCALSRWQRIGKFFNGLRDGNLSAKQISKSIGIWLFWKIHRTFLGVYPHGSQKDSPSGSLSLQPGEWVEVRSIKGIKETLNVRGANRGLQFFSGMHLYCGKQYQVKGRLDRIIEDGTGRMRKLGNTVLLEESTCRCAYLGFGMAGCCRREFAYWREVWLRRPDRIPETSHATLEESA